MGGNFRESFSQLDIEDEKNVVGGIAFTAIITGLLALIFGIQMMEKLTSSPQGKVKLPLGISGEWKNEETAANREIIHSQTVSPTFYN